MKLKDVMTKDIQTTDPDMRLVDAAYAMKKHDIGILPVVNKHRELVGAITDRDIAVRCVANARDPRKEKVSDHMSRSLNTLDVGQTLEDAASCMQNQKLRRVFVVDGDKKKLAGVVSMADLAARSEDREMVHETLRHVSASG
jgi:CBS domain-containing protein